MLRRSLFPIFTKIQNFGQNLNPRIHSGSILTSISIPKSYLVDQFRCSHLSQTNPGFAASPFSSSSNIKIRSLDHRSNNESEISFKIQSLDDQCNDNIENDVKIQSLAIECDESSENSANIEPSDDQGSNGNRNCSVDRIYEVIMSNSGAERRGLEAALDELDESLSTEVVNEVLHRLRYEEKLAFRFFTWVGHRTGYVHEHETYNFMIDVLSSTRYKARQFGVVCDVLDHLKRSNNKKSLSADSLVSILKIYTEKQLTHLRKFAKKKRVKKMKTPPETDAFNLLLDAFCKCSLVSEAEIIFDRLKKKVKPNSETYNIMLFGWCRVRDPKKAMKVLDGMIQTGHTPENFTYNAALDSFCSVGLVTEARELFEFMRTKGSTISSPTAKTYTIMIVELAKCDRLDECFKLISDMKCRGCLPDVSTYKEMIEGMCLAGKTEAAYKVLDEMASTGFRPDILTYNCFLKVLCNLPKPEEALKLCDRMIAVGCKPSVHTYNMMITMFLELKDPDNAINIWNEMDKRGCPRSEETYGTMIDGLFNCDKASDACFLLEEVINRKIKLSYQKFDSILLCLSTIGNLNAIHRLSEHMRRFYSVAMARRFAISQKKKSLSLRRT